MKLFAFVFKYLAQNTFSFMILSLDSPVHTDISCLGNPITVLILAYDLALNNIFILLCYCCFNKKMSFRACFVLPIILPSIILDPH